MMSSWLYVLFLIVCMIQPTPSFFVAQTLGFNGTERYEINANRSIELVIDDYSLSFKQVSFAVLQAHSQKFAFTASLNETPNYYENAMRSTNPGFVVYYRSSSRHGTFRLYLKSDDAVTSQVVEAMALQYPSYAPIPGGCCQTCDIDTDPTLNVTFNPWYTRVRFEIANSGYNASTQNPPLCAGGDGFEKLTYQLYLYRFGEMSYSEDLALSAWQKMATVDGLKSHGTEVGSSLSLADIKLVTVSSVPGQGVVYNILVYDPNTNMEAVYVPYISYGCSFKAKVDGCDAVGSVLTMVIMSIAGLIGLFFCFAGHRYFIIEVFLVGFLYVAFFSFVLLSNYVDWSHDARLGTSASLGILGGILFFIIYFRFYLILGFVLLGGVVLGFLFSSLLFFTPFGDLSPWQNLLDYWVAFVCGMLIPAVFLLMWPRTLNVVTTSVVGSYVFIIGVNTYVHGVLSYVVLDIIKKAVMPGEIKAYTDYPFEMPDIILASVWGFLSVTGIIFQLWRERKDKRPNLPPWPYQKWKASRSRNYGSKSGSVERSGERRRLLETAGSDSVSSYGSLSDR